MDPSDITDEETCLANHYKWFDGNGYTLCMEDIAEGDCIAPEKQWYMYHGEGYCMKNMNTDKDSCLTTGNYWVTIRVDYGLTQVRICVDTPMKEHVFCELNNIGNGYFECGPGINHYTGEELVSEKDCFCGEA